MTEKIAVPVSQRLVAEVYARAGVEADVTPLVEQVLEDFLDRTRYDDDRWQESWLEQRDLEDEEQKDVGPPSGGYRWGPLFLRNGTRIRMEYRGENHYAEVSHDRILYQGEAYSPSRLASTIAQGTSRNAWRDLWIQPPGSSTWTLADQLRRKT